MLIKTEVLYTGMALGFAGVAAVFDVKTRRIPNWLSGAGVVIGLTTHLLLSGVSQAGLSLLAGALAGGGFLLFYIVGGIGAGDVKLITAIGCLLGMTSLKEVLIATVLSGALCGLALICYRGKTRQTARNLVELLTHHARHGMAVHPELNVRSEGTLRMPYAVAIALGCLFVFSADCLAGGGR